MGDPLEGPERGAHRAKCAQRAANVGERALEPALDRCLVLDRDAGLEPAGDGLERRLHPERKQVCVELHVGDDRPRRRRTRGGRERFARFAEAAERRRGAAGVGEPVERQRRRVEPHERGDVGVELIAREVVPVETDVARHEEVGVDQEALRAAGAAERVAQPDLELMAIVDLDLGPDDGARRPHRSALGGDRLRRGDGAGDESRRGVVDDHLQALAIDSQVTTVSPSRCVPASPPR